MSQPGPDALELLLTDAPNRRTGVPLTDDEVADAYPWPESGAWVRAMMLTALDGAAAGPDHLSKSLTTPADGRVMRAVRRWSDAVLIGAGTLRAERYTPLRATEEDQAARVAAGQLPGPVLAVVSSSLDLPPDLPLWSGSTQRPLVLTGPEPDPVALAALEPLADVVRLPDLAPHTLVEALTSAGLRRVVCEGGPTLLHQLAISGLVDEADITLAPLFAGTAGSPRTAALAVLVRGRLVQVLRGGDYLMNRYLIGTR